MLLRLILCAVLLLGASPKRVARDDAWTFVPGERVGRITASTSEAELVRMFGREQVERRPLAGDGGDSRVGTIVLGRTLDALEVLWRDDAFLEPERVIIGGGKTRWRGREGLTVGTSLEELVKLNGRAFTLHGFGWERGGTVASWQGGRLAASYRLGETASIRLGPDRGFDDLTPEERQRISGEREVSSSSPILARLGLRVWEIVLLFP